MGHAHGRRLPTGPSCAEQFRDAVRAFTLAVRAAKRSKDEWLRRNADVLPTEKQDLSQYIKKRRVQTGATVDDLAEDFPEGPYGMAAHCDAAYAQENGISDAADGLHADDSVDGDIDPDDGDADHASEAEYEEDSDADVDDVGLELAVADAADFANVSADDAEWELQCALDAPPATAVQLAKPQVHATALEKEADLWEPEGGTTKLFTVGGEVVEVELNHRAALGVLQARRRLVYQLSLDPRTGKEMVVRPSHMRVPKVNVEFDIDHMQLAHSSGRDLIAELRAVVNGDMPQIPCRFRFCSADVQDEMQRNGMCMVIGCKKLHAKGADASMHFCAGHRSCDHKIASTGEIVRPCTGCHAEWSVTEFRAANGNATTGGTCTVCRANRRRLKVQKAARKAGGEPAVVHIPERVPPSDGELRGGMDEDHSFRQEKSLAAQRHNRNTSHQGSTLTNPYMVYGMYARARMANPHACVRVGCNNEIGLGRAGATLCQACAVCCPPRHPCPRFPAILESADISHVYHAWSCVHESDFPTLVSRLSLLTPTPP